jgi:hypothetical protein
MPPAALIVVAASWAPRANATPWTAVGPLCEATSPIVIDFPPELPESPEALLPLPHALSEPSARASPNAGMIHRRIMCPSLGSTSGRTAFRTVFSTL